MIKLKGWRFAAFLGGLAGFTGALLYPIIVQPMLNPDEYKKLQQKTRANIKQEDIQPGNMRVWSDPFGPMEKK